MNRASIGIILFICLLFIAGPILAQVVIENPLSYNSFYDLFTGIASAVSVLIAALGGVMVVVSGIFFLTSAGSPERIGLAKKCLGLAVIGMAVGLGASAITDIVNGVTSNGFETDIMAIINNIAEQVGMFIAALGTTMIIVSGIFFLTSAGSPERIGLAKKALTYSIVGIAIGLGATSIVSAIVGLFQ